MATVYTQVFLNVIKTLYPHWTDANWWKWTESGLLVTCHETTLPTNQTKKSGHKSLNKVAVGHINNDQQKHEGCLYTKLMSSQSNTRIQSMNTDKNTRTNQSHISEEMTRSRKHQNQTRATKATLTVECSRPVRCSWIKLQP